MRKTKRILWICVAVACSLAMLAFSSFDRNRDLEDSRNIAMRHIGHKLLWQNGDSISVVPAVIQIDRSTFRLSFAKPFRFSTDSLVALTEHEAAKGRFPKKYTVKVYNSGERLAYGYEMPALDSTACLGRPQPQDSYRLDVTFTDISESSNTLFYASAIPIVIVFLSFGFKRSPKIPESGSQRKSLKIGAYEYFPETQLLVIGQNREKLTAKEANVLSIFASRQNELITREELQNEVWESKGVIVGRSLDVFISRLRKKFEGDENVKIVNVHGSGYKLIVSAS
ncbi:helix-turn-helix domain-containing protein [Flavobacterium sp. MAH-1]|uniref:Helix-turn-helix domain-containing protein n=1 Tax=Flavobacterium agri TaxID=2743471 RepID=A0A7Y9C462_9FLAO|nr:helix-turn-helix domain-containing protein [Flavobacterium agri]NUY79545.1 helix-turn-helix domain-containing protein [Flavobacterium agri]NYA69570.1 helix-turn-helix domain-containing protein [Flavobacterium agri]